MNQKKIEDLMEEFDDMLIDILLKDKDIKKEDLDKLMKEILERRTPYYRIFSDFEQQSLDAEAYGYLFHLLRINSLDRDTFEHIISVSTELSNFINTKINKVMVDDILNFVMFSGKDNVRVKDIYDFFLTNRTKINYPVN